MEALGEHQQPPTTVVLFGADRMRRFDDERPLRAAGMRVVRALDRTEAIRQAMLAVPNVVVVLDGGGVAKPDLASLPRELHARPEAASVPVIAVAPTSPQLQVEAAAAGVDEVIDTTSDSSVLLAAVRRVIEISRQLRQRSAAAISHGRSMQAQSDAQFQRARNLTERTDRIMARREALKARLSAQAEPGLQHGTRNDILSALSVGDHAELATEYETVELKRRQTLVTAGEPLKYVYFIGSGAVSLLATTRGGEILDTGFLGHDGVVGLEAFFGIATVQHQTLVMLPGVALRMPVEAFARRCAPGSMLHRSMQRYAWARMMQVAHSALCDATHSISQRCTRRLLSFHDYAGSDHFPLTQQALAALLGVRRASVSVAAEKLQADGRILYEHGRMHITDRPGLEQAGCGCYQSICQLFRQASTQA